MRNIIIKFSSFLLFLLGLYNLFVAVSLLFYSPGFKKEEGDFIYFIIFINLLSAIIYLTGSFGFFKEKAWIISFLFFSTLILVVSFIGVLFHVLIGGSYDEKIILTITFRTFITCIFTGVAWKYLSKKMELPAY